MVGVSRSGLLPLTKPHSKSSAAAPHVTAAAILVPSFLSDGNQQMNIVSLSFGIYPSDNQTLLVHSIVPYSVSIQ